MKFQSLLEDMQIINAYSLKNRVLGVNGILLHLPNKVIYLYTVERNQEYGLLFLENEVYKINRIDIKKINALLRLNQVETKKVNEDMLIVYSRHINRAMDDKVRSEPNLVRGSSDLAFSSKMYTRFNESRLFDFDYIYDDIGTVDIINNFENVYEKGIHPHHPHFYKNKGWSDDIMYRYLTDYVRQNKESINGQIHPPLFIKKLYAYFRDYPAERLMIDLGPQFLILRTDEDVDTLFPGTINEFVERYEKRGYTIIRFDKYSINKVLNTEIDETVIPYLK